MLIADVLPKLDKINLYADVSLNNTVVNDVSRRHVVGGCATPLAGRDRDITYKSNALKRITNSQPKYGNGDEIVLGGFSYQESIGAPFSSAQAAKSFGAFSLYNIRSDDNFSVRNWEDVVFEMRAGGVVDGVEMEHDEYPVWQKGIIKSFTVNNESIDLAMLLNSSSLDVNFPTGSYISGPSQGLAKPYIFGTVNDYAPRNLGDGIWQFHDGLVDTSAPLRYTLKYWYEGASNADWSFIESPAAPTTPVVTYAASAITWASVDDQNVAATISSELSVNVSSPDADIKLTPLGGSRFSVAYDDNESDKFTSSDFNWNIVDSKNANNSGEPNLTVQVDGDIDIVEVGGRWLKIAADGTGRVSINTSRKIKSATLVIRAVRKPNQSVSSFNVAAGSIQPSFDIYDDPGVSVTDVFNHKLTYEDLNAGEISFDYTANTDVLLCAIWFEKIELYDNKVVDLVVDYSDRVASQLFNYIPGSNASSILSVHNAPNANLSTIGNEQYFDLSGNFTSLNVKLEIGHSTGIFDFTEIQYDANQDNLKYGVYVSEDMTLIIAPRPPSQFSGSPDTQAEIRLTVSNEYDSVLRFRARILPRNTGDENLDQVDLKVGSVSVFSVETTVSVTPEWNDFEIKIPQRMDFTNFDPSISGPAFSPESSNVVSIKSTRESDVDYQIECKDLYTDLIIGSITTDSRYPGIPILNNTLPTPPFQDIFVRNVNTDVDSKLKVFRVDSVFNYPSLPPFDFCIYDSNGYIRCAEDYDQIQGDFVGSKSDILSVEALNDLSTLATGRSLANADFAGESVGFVCDEIRTIREWYDFVSTPIDYIFFENSVDDNVTMRKRSNLSEYPADFYLTIDDFVPDSEVTRVAVEPRQTQYIVSYQQGVSNPEKSHYSRSNVLPFRGQTSKQILTSLRLKADADYLSGLCPRDAARNGIFSGYLKGMRLSLELGMVGIIDHPDVPKRRACEIRLLEPNSDEIETKITFKVFERD